MKKFLTIPQAREFFDRYAPLIHTLNKTTPLTQVISAATEVGVIYSAVDTSVSQVLPELALPIAVTCAILGTALIELGLRVLFPYGWRAILFRRFQGLDYLMSVVILTALAMIAFASGALSFMGGKQVVVDNMPPPELETTIEAEELASREKGEALAVFSADSANIAGRYAAQVEAENASYGAQIDAQRAQVKYYRQREALTGQSFASARAAAEKKASELEAERAQKVAALRTSEASELAQAVQVRASALASISGKLNDKRAAVESANEEAEAKHKAKTEGIGLGAGWFTLICLLYFALVSLLFEAMKKGSEMEDKPEVNQYHFSDSWWSELQEALSERFNYWIRSRIQRFADRTPEAPLPAKVKSLYDLRELVAEAVKVEVEKQSTGGGDLIQIPAARRAIGFNNASSVNNATVITQADKNRKNCLHCGQEYQAKVSWQKYCTTQCKDAYHASQHGGQSFNPGAYHSTKKGKP